MGSIFKNTIYPIRLAENCLILYWFCYVDNPSFCNHDVASFPGPSTLTDICACGLAGSSFDNNVPSFLDRSTLASLYATGHTEGSRGVNRYAFHMARFVLKGMHVHVLA